MVCESQYGIPISELWDGLNPLGFDEGTFVVLRGYIDESVKDDDYFTLSCLISEGKQWNELEKDWRGILAAKNHELFKCWAKSNFSLPRYRLQWTTERISRMAQG